MGYLLDANVFIQAKNLHYGFDFCPAFWEWRHRREPAEARVQHREGGRRARGGQRRSREVGLGARSRIPDSSCGRMGSSWRGWQR
jgi:Domain of unknown function (DUF4411)